MNERIIGKIAIFLGGAMLGSLVTYQLVSRKYESLIDEELDSMRDMYDEKMENLEARYKEIVEENAVACEDTINTLRIDASKTIAKSRERYEQLAKEYDKRTTALYSNNDDDAEDELENETDTEQEDDAMVKPYTIHPDEFGDTDYEQKCLTLYADGFVEDDQGDIWDEDDVYRLLGGDENLDKMGEWEDGLVYIRNDNNKVDYEVAQDLNNYQGD